MRQALLRILRYLYYLILESLLAKKFELSRIIDATAGLYTPHLQAKLQDLRYHFKNSHTSRLCFG